MCFKKRYPDKNSARKELRRLRKNAARTERKLYQCPECSYWHLTSQAPGEQKQRPVSHLFKSGRRVIEARYLAGVGADLSAHDHQVICANTEE